MKQQMKTLGIALSLGIAGMLTAADSNAQGGRHPAYLHALSDLRAARWMLEHRPGNWKQSMEEQQAENEINGAISDLKKAAVDDGKSLDDHPMANEIPERMGRLRKALDFLKQARQDISHEEDNGWANGLRDRSYHHIDEAIKDVKIALHSGGPGPGGMR